jgi:hypothetical protein
MATVRIPYKLDWPIYDHTTVDQRRTLLRAFLDSDEPGEDADKILSFLPYSEYGGDLRTPSRDNTARAYRGDQRAYIAACAKANVDPLRPTPAFWKRYFHEFAKGGPKKKRRRHATVERHAFGIANLFFMHNLPSPTRTGTHRRLMQELASEDDRPTRKARPLYGDDLHQLIASYPCRELRSLRDRAIACTGGNRAFRAASITNIQLDGMRLERKGIVLTLYGEKTQRTGDPRLVATPHNKGHRSCMPCAIWDLAQALRALGFHHGPLFRPIDRWNKVGNGKLSTKSVTALLRKGLRNAGIQEPESYSSHSYRHGVVKKGAMLGLSLDEICAITLHRSERGLRAYIADIDPWYFAPPRLVVDMEGEVTTRPIAREPKRPMRTIKERI